MICGHWEKNVLAGNVLQKVFYFTQYKRCVYRVILGDNFAKRGVDHVIVSATHLVPLIRARYSWVSSTSYRSNCDNAQKCPKTCLGIKKGVPSSYKFLRQSHCGSQKSPDFCVIVQYLGTGVRKGSLWGLLGQVIWDKNGHWKDRSVRWFDRSFCIF